MVTLIGDLIFATQRQAIFVLLRKNEFGYEVFKCVSGSTFPNSVTYLSTLQNNVSFHVAKVIASFTCNFWEIIRAPEECTIYKMF